MATVRICVFLLLFLSRSWAEEEENVMINMKQDNSIITVDLWSELKELRDLVIQQKTEMTSKIETLEEEKTVLDARLTDKIEKLEQEKTVLDAEVEELKRKKTETPKVAFSLALTNAGQIGPFPSAIRLIFSKVLTNFGQAYDTNTGVFTAPLRGAYYFRFTGFSNTTNRSLGVFLYHNEKAVSWNIDYNDEVGYTSVSNGLVLELEKGDVVYLVLPGNHIVYDDSTNRTVFSGFLIFPL